MTASMAVALVIGSSTAGHAQPAAADDPLAYAIAVQAAIYGLPIVGMSRRLSAEVLDPATRKAPFNAYFHYTQLSTPQVSPFRAPNNDTLYSTAWLDLRGEPVILEMPDTGGRYYTASCHGHDH
jgi:hypothetical protein